MIGKIGTDIQDNKCSWLVVQALQRAQAPQLAVLKARARPLPAHTRCHACCCGCQPHPQSEIEWCGCSRKLPLKSVLPKAGSSCD